MDEITEVEVFNSKATVVRDVCNVWHVGLRRQLIAGSAVLENRVSRYHDDERDAVQVVGLSGEIYPATPHFSWFASWPIASNFPHTHQSSEESLY